MLEYLVKLGGQGSQQFRGTFSDADFTHLLSPRVGRAFDLEHFKAYVMPDGQIALARKPDYVDCATVELALLVEALRTAITGMSG
jgi:hypothetical protein